MIRLLFAPVAALLIVMIMIAQGCGRAPATILRNGQAPVYDFPLYVTSGATGIVWKFNRDASREVFYSGLNDPRGLASDRFNNLYVVEQGNGRLVKINTKSKVLTVVKEGLVTPTVVAVDSFGEAYVSQDGLQNVIRASDSKILGTYSTIPSALAFGVNDLMLVGLFADNKVYWGANTSAKSTTVNEPVNISTDATGRVFVAEGSASGARVLRFHQREPGEPAVVADGLSGPVGVAVDSVGNMYVVEQGAARIVLVTHDREFYSWATAIIDPYYLAFTQY